MSAKLSVIFYIVLCLEIGIVLTLLPWIPQGTLGLSDWGNNYFLLYAARKTGLYGIQTVVASGWIRGAVTGFGLLNIGIAFWEIFHFRQTVSNLQESTEPRSTKDAAKPANASHLPDHERGDDRTHDAGE
jgi:predicted membrane-bound spermidine synthase